MRHLLPIVYVLSATFLASCKSVPKETPLLMRLNNERLANLNKTYNADSTAMRNHLLFVKNDIQQLVDDLKNVNTAALNDAEKEKLSDIRDDAVLILDYLAPLAADNVMDFPANSMESAVAIMSTYEAVTDILQVIVQDRALVSDLVGRAQAELGIQATKND